MGIIQLKNGVNEVLNEKSRYNINDKNNPDFL